jgi:hypothetical protein
VVIRNKDTKQMVLPEGMSLRDAAAWCLRKDEQEGKAVGIYAEFDCFPLDGVVNFRRAIEEIYGFAADVDIPGSFFTPDQPPILVSIPISRTESKQIAWGRLQIPGVEGYLQTGMTGVPFPKFILSGQTKQRHQPDIDRIVAKTKEMLAKHSIYKGQAVRLDLSWMRDSDPPRATQSLQPALLRPEVHHPDRECAGG